VITKSEINKSLEIIKEIICKKYITIENNFVK
jgi:hypothetical protein